MEMANKSLVRMQKPQRARSACLGQSDVLICLETLPDTEADGI